jgi:hypothetical protein
VICLNCGQELDNTTSVCPYCGNVIQAVDDSEYFEEELHPIYVEGGYQEGYAESESYAQEQDYEEHEYEEEFVDADPVYGKKSKGFGKKFSMPHVSKPNISKPKVGMPRASGLPVGGGNRIRERLLANQMATVVFTRKKKRNLPAQYIIAQIHPDFYRQSEKKVLMV